LLCGSNDVGMSATVTVRTVYGDALSAWTTELARTWRGRDAVRRPSVAYCVGRMRVSGTVGWTGGVKMWL
jgi:hypothetical protein